MKRLAVEFGGSVASPLPLPEVKMNMNISSNRPLATMTTTTPINNMVRPGSLAPNLTQT